MASAEVHQESEKEDAISLACLKDSSTGDNEASCSKVNNCHSTSDETQVVSSNIGEDPVVLQAEHSDWTDVLPESTLNPSLDSDTSNSAGDLEKIHFNGLKSETVEQKEHNNKNRLLHVNAEGWPLRVENQGLPEKRLNTNLPYTYGTKSGTFQPGLPKSFRGSSKRHYGMSDSSSICQPSPGGSTVNTSCHGSGKGEHVVLLHVNPGETISFYMSDHTQHIQGPATVRMVSCNSTPPMPVPVQVPPGHMVQQLADENWTLREIILSPQPPVAMPVGSPYSAGSSYNSATTASPAGPLPFYVYPHLSYPPPMQFHTHMQPGLTNHTMHGGHVQPPHNSSQSRNGQGQYAPVSPPAGMHKDERTQKQFFKLKKRLEARQKDGTSMRAEMADSSRSDDSVRDVPTDYDNKEDLGTDHSKIYDFLSSVTVPSVSEITARSALATWSPLLVLDDSDVFDAIKSENILYNLLISDKGPDSGKKIAYRGKLLEYHLQDLKPGTSYYLCLQATLNEVCGKSSEYAAFKTLASHPEPPQPPKLLSRTKTSLSLKWNAAVDNGSRILSYILEYDEGLGGDTFTEVFNGLQKQYKSVKLKASTCYRFRLAAVNELGQSDFSEVACFSTSGSPPSQPSPPELLESTSNTLSLRWEARPNDDSFTLQMEEESSLHGFLPVYNGKETSYTCSKLRRNCQYKFRLCANNEEGSSLWSQVVEFCTLPEKPASPGRPTLKGRVHSTSFKVTWEPPKDTGGSDIKSYDLEVDSGNGFEGIYCGPELEYLCEHLRPGTTYSLQVRCTSDGGTSSFSEPCVIETLPVVPGKCQPPRLSGKPKSTFLHIKWALPDYDGGSEVLEYEVEILNPDSSRRQVYKGPGTDCVVAGLFPGRQYSIFVRAYNKAGHGPYSDALETATGAGTPDVPKEVQAVPRSPHSIFVSWTEPSNNGAVITEYRLESSHNESPHIVYSGAHLSTEVKNLFPATSYSFRVQAVNAAGAGPFSDCIKCQTPASSPGSISGACIKIISSATSIALSWKEPNDHGSAITSYNIEIGDSISTTVDAPELCVEGLTPETTYRVRIQAVNSIGLGPFTSLKVTTRGLPPNPPFLECSGYSHSSLRLKWGDGKNPEFIQYTLEMLNPHTKSFVPIYQGTGHCHKISRLDECTEYNFRIYASNNEGDGLHSDVYSFTTLKAVPPTPKSPKIISVTETTCTVEWLPTRSIGDDMVSYKLQLGSKTSDYNVAYTGIQTSFVLHDLHPGTEYSVRVAAIRHCGDGSGELSSPFSPSSVFCTNSQASKQPAPKAPSVISTWTEREPLTDQQWAIIILCGFTIFAISVAILTHWILSYANS